MEDTTITTQPVEGTSEGTEAQVAEPASQDVEQQQETGQTEVDSSEQQTSSESPERPAQPSDYYLVRKQKRKIKELEDKYNTLMNRFEQQYKQTSVAQPTELTQDQLEKLKYEDPYKWIELRDKQREDQLNKKLESLEKDLPSRIQQWQQQQELVRQEQEALEKLFPKDPNNPDADLEDRVQMNLDRSKRIQGIIDQYGLSQSLNSNPIKAADAILAIYESQKTQQSKPMNPAAPKKAHVQTVNSGKSANNQTNLKQNMADVSKARQELIDKLRSDPSLYSDPEYKKQAEALDSKYNELYQMMLGR